MIPIILAEAIYRAGGNGDPALRPFPLGLGKANHVRQLRYTHVQRRNPSIQLRIFHRPSPWKKPRGKSELEPAFSAAPGQNGSFAGYPELSYAVGAPGAPAPVKCCRVDEFFFSGGYAAYGRAASQRNYICANYTPRASVICSSAAVNVVAQLVAKQGAQTARTRLSLSCNPDLTLDALAAPPAGGD